MRVRMHSRANACIPESIQSSKRVHTCARTTICALARTLVRIHMHMCLDTWHWHPGFSRRHPLVLHMHRFVSACMCVCMRAYMRACVRVTGHAASAPMCACMWRVSAFVRTHASAPLCAYMSGGCQGRLVPRIPGCSQHLGSQQCCGASSQQCCAGGTFLEFTKPVKRTETCTENVNRFGSESCARTHARTLSQIREEIWCLGARRMLSYFCTMRSC